jgi:hypothetical protein
METTANAEGAVEKQVAFTLRLYWPKEEMLHKSWVPPAVQLVK